MNSNDLRKGDVVVLQNGWVAHVCDNAKGNTRTLKVFGYSIEMGSCYVWDIRAKLEPAAAPADMEKQGRCFMAHDQCVMAGAIKEGLYNEIPVELTDKQKKARRAIAALGF